MGLGVSNAPEDFTRAPNPSAGLRYEEAGFVGCEGCFGLPGGDPPGDGGEPGGESNSGGLFSESPRVPKLLNAPP